MLFIIASITRIQLITKASLVEAIYNCNSNYFLITQKHFSSYSSASRKLILSLPHWMADLKPTMDYKGWRWKKQDFAVQEVGRGKIAVKIPQQHITVKHQLLKKGSGASAAWTVVLNELFCNGKNMAVAESQGHVCPKYPLWNFCSLKKPVQWA